MTRTLSGPLLAALLVAAAACGEAPSDDESGSLDTERWVDNASVGGQATVTASELNLRSGPSTSHSILAAMPHGATVDVLGASNGWYRVRYAGQIGWCSGVFLAPKSGHGNPPPKNSSSVAAALSRAQSGVGFSYHWGAGCWQPGSASHGACYGSCPSCSHSGQWGADCSGYVAKVWQVPGASAVTTCSHPYSTWNFYNTHDHWRDVSRSSLHPGDALVHHSGGAGHIFIYDGGDGWGWMKAYEAKGCATGIVHDSRTAGSIYKAIRREGF